MIKFTRYFLDLLKLTLLTATAIVCAAGIYVTFSLATSPSARRTFADATGIRAFGYFSPPRQSSEVYALPQSQQDLLTVYTDHQVIAEWVLGCMGARSDVVLPGAIWNDVRLLPRQVWGSDPPDTHAPNFKYPDSIRAPSRPEKALIALSRAISEQRIFLLQKVHSAYLFWEITSILSISLGMITTILVSVSSTDFPKSYEQYKTTIRILAIIFPAFGTGVAAVIAFYSPQADWGQASRKLASETQLQGQIVQDIGKLECVGPGADPKGDEAKAFAKMYEESSKPLHCDPNCSQLDWLN